MVTQPRPWRSGRSVSSQPESFVVHRSRRVHRLPSPNWRIALRAMAAAALLAAVFSGSAGAQTVALSPTRVSDVSDPMLAPPPEAPRQIASWEEALNLIRTQSPDYLASEEAVARAEAEKRIALAAVLPVLTGVASYTHQFKTVVISIQGTPSFETPPSDLWSIGGTATWNILNPRGIHSVGTAAENVSAAKLALEDRRRVIAIAVVSAMLTTLAASRVAELDRVGLRAALERQVLAQTRLAYAQGTALDVDRAAEDVASARSLLINGDEALRQAREALGAALGSVVPISAPGDLDLDQFEDAVARTCRLNDDIERRPDVAAARARLDAAERTVVDAQLLLAPSLGINSQLAANSVAVLGPMTTWSVQGVLTVPLYDGGARYGAIRDARAAAEQARQALVSTRINAVVNSAQSQRAVGVLKAERDVARAQRDLAQRIDQRTREGYAGGLGTSLDLVTSAQALRQAEINLALLEFQFGAARANAVLANAECLS
jgi:multidrug efflux system outer membrane protein